MTLFDYAASLVASATAPVLFVGIAFSNDALLSKSASEAITNAIRDVTERPGTSQWSVGLEQLLSEYFPPKGNPGKFWTYVFAMTLASLVCVLAVYCAKTPDLIRQL